MGLPAYSGGNTRGYKLGDKLYFFEFSPYRGYSLRQVQIGKKCLDCSDGQTFRDYANNDDNIEVVDKTFRFTARAKSLAVDLPTQAEYEKNLK